VEYIVFFGTWAVLIGVSLFRLYTYVFGQYANEIYLPSNLLIFAIASIFIPPINWLITAYIALVCKPAGTLHNTRKHYIDNFTPQNLVDYVAYQVNHPSAVGNRWVEKVWNKKSSQAWVAHLSTHDDLLRDALSQITQIHCSKVELWGSFGDVVDRYNMLLKRRELDAAPVVVTPLDETLATA